MTEEEKICKKCGAVKEWANGKACKPCRQAYRKRPDVKNREKEARSTPHIKERDRERQKEYESIPEVKERIKERRKAYLARPEVKERIKELQSKPRIKEWFKAYLSKPEVKQRLKDRRKEYYSENKEFFKEYSKEYLSKPEVKQRRHEYKKEYYSNPENKERKKQKAKEYLSNPENRERKNKIGREYLAKPEIKQRLKDYHKKFGGQHHRRAEKRGAYSERFSRLDIFKRDKYKCAYCGKKLTVAECVLEHKIPIRWKGSNTPANCTTSCKPCNMSKGTKLLNGIQISIFDLLE